jgi:hypothetical protein
LTFHHNNSYKLLRLIKKMEEILKVFSVPFVTYISNSKSVYHNSTIRLIRKTYSFSRNFNSKSLKDCVFKEEAKVLERNYVTSPFVDKNIAYYNKWINRTFLEAFDPKKDYSKIEIEDIN